MPEERKKKRGGDVKKAPSGYYTAKDAMKRLGLNSSSFYYYVRNGTIPKETPPLRKEGFYPKKEIDRMAAKMAFVLQSKEEEEEVEFRTATVQDIPGIYAVIASLWGPNKTTPIELRESWYAINPEIDHIILWHGEIEGYVNAVAYLPPVLEGMMSGVLRGWNIQPSHILPFTPGVYDLFVGIAVRQDIPNPTYHAGKLIVGFLDFIEELVKRGVVIRHMYAVSDQPMGEKLCKKMGFHRDTAKEGDLFPRYVLDFEEESDNPF